MRPPGAEREGLPFTYSWSLKPHQEASKWALIIWFRTVEVHKKSLILQKIVYKKMEALSPGQIFSFPAF